MYFESFYIILSISGFSSARAAPLLNGGSFYSRSHRKRLERAFEEIGAFWDTVFSSARAALLLNVGFFYSRSYRKRLNRAFEEIGAF